MSLGYEGAGVIKNMAEFICNLDSKCRRMVNISRRFTAPASPPRTDKGATVIGWVALAAIRAVLGKKSLGPGMD
jgi:hypothetical protein